MKRIAVFVMAASAAFFSSATVMRAKDGNDSIMLEAKECHAVIRDKIPDEYKDQFNAASVIFEGKSMLGCWALNPPEVVVILEDGRIVSAPMKMFKPDEGV